VILNADESMMYRI